MNDVPDAMLIVKDYGHHVFGFTWVGQPDALLAISGIFEKLPIFRLIPWRIEKVAHDAFHDVGLYRRAG